MCCGLTAQPNTNTNKSMNPNLSLYLVCGMIGIMVFFTIAVAPTVFKVLPQEWASKYVRNFFPKYYAFLGAVLFFISLWVLTPAINRASDQGNKKKFGILHGASVVVNFIQLGIFVYLVW
jgi:zinc transporter ZupT